MTRRGLGLPGRSRRRSAEPGSSDAAVLAGALHGLARHRPAPLNRVVVVVDRHASMVAWRDTVTDLLRLLRRDRGVEQVVELALDTDTADPAEVRLRPAGADTDPDGVIAGTSGTVVVVLTDGAAAAWHADAALPPLRAWSQRHPVVIVHLLPQRLWYRTGLHPQWAELRATALAAPNAELEWRLDGVVRATAPDAVPVPVLRPQWLPAWSRLLTGSGPEWTGLPAVLAWPWTEPPHTGEAHPGSSASRWEGPAGPGAHAGSPDSGGTSERRAVPSPPMDPREQVRSFTSWATPTAVTLATHLAAAPLNLPLIHELQRELVPASDASHLSEILNSGLLHPVAPATAVADRHRVTFEFGSGVREELLAAGRRAETVRVLRMVDRYLGPAVPAVRGLSRVLEDPDHGPVRAVTAETEPFVRAEQVALQALSGRYLARSRRLQALLPPRPLPGAPPGGDASRDEPSPATISTLAQASVPPEPGGTGVSPRTVTDEPSAATVPAARPPSVPVIWGNVPPRNPNFTGREELLGLLRERMQTGTTAVLPQALRGMGGVGKSQLAVEYVYRHQHDYDLIWWIPAERTPQAKVALAELGQRMGLAVSEQVNAALPVVLNALRVGQPYRNWLLIFDNAESPETLRECMPSGGPGTILVTSRNPRWSAVAGTLEVDVFKREESIQLLRRRRPELSTEAADQVSEALGDLPLAIEQAAAWLAETGMPAEEYLRLFEEKRADLLQVSAPVDYQLPVAAAWNVSLDQLTARNPAALRLLQVCSFLASEPIPRSLLGGSHSRDIHPDLNQTLRDPMRLNRAIREINRYALAKINYRDNSIHMHRLIQAVLFDRLSDEERDGIRHSAHLLLAGSDPNDPTAPRTWPTYAELYPHVMASRAYRSGHPWVQQLVDNEGQYLYWWGDHEAARELSQSTYDWRLEHLGPEASATLRSGSWLAFMNFVTGRYPEAARVNRELLAAHQRVSDEDTEQLLDTLGAIAADRRVAGEFAEALEIAEDVHGRHVRAFGDDDPLTLWAAHHLAVNLRLVGDFARALRIDEDTEERRTLLFGEDHPVTLVSTQAAILDRRELGDYVTAQTRQQAVVERLRSLLDERHPQTLAAMRNLAVAMRKAGDHAGARAASERAREGFLARYGPDNPDSVVATLTYAIDLRATGDLAVAAELSEDAHQRFERLLGAAHPHTVAAALNLAIVERLRGNLAGARRLNEAGYATLAASLGESHPVVLGCALNLASDLYAQGEFQQAYDRNADTSTRLRELWGEDHPTTLGCRGNLAMDLVALGREEEAREVHSDAVARFRRLLGDHHPATHAAEDLTLRADCDIDPMPL